MSASSICNLPGCVYKATVLICLTLGDLADVDTRRDQAVPSVWDFSAYSDFTQTWLENDFSAAYGRERVSTLAITSEVFPDTMNSESPSTLFHSQEPFRAEPSVLKQSNLGDDSWRSFLSANLTSSVDDAYPSPLSAQGTGKENMPPQLDDFPGFSGSSFWTDSPTAHSPQRPNPGVPDAFTRLSHSPPPMCLPQAPTRSQIQRKWLFGWGDTSHLQTPNLISVLRRRSLSRSSDVGAVLDPHVLTLNVDSPLRKRPRQSTLSSGSSGTKSESLSLDFTDGDGSPDESESDDYRPSCSPSPKFERFKRLKRKPSSDPATSPKPAFRTLKRKISKSKKAKKKGSAALALAVVTHVGEVKREAETLQVSLDPDSFDPVRVYQEGSYVAKKRKNQPIPIPVPVPNLNKKSRGRKVPFVVSKQESPDPSSGDTPSFENNPGGRLRESTRSRKKAQPMSPSDESGSRSYVCDISGCGKCFVRGEHLKRHVRSIHTNDKRKFFISWMLFLLIVTLAHICPIEGCDKSFSRRDNLGQHVRVHLQSCQ